jgi:CHAT domain-containing protein
MRTWGAVGAVLGLLLAGVAQGAAPPLPPYLRLLSGAEARRAERLQKQIDAHVEAGELAEALALAKDLAELRRRQQGEGHWQAVAAGWQVRTLERAARLPEAGRREYASLPGLERQASGLYRQGRYAPALSLFEKVLAIRRKALGEVHPHTALSYGWAANCLQRQGKTALALTLFEKDLAICRKALGEDDPLTAQSYLNLAACLQAQGKAPLALPLYQKALAICRKVLSEQHAHTATGYNGLASCLQDQGKAFQALPLFEKALAIYRRALGEEHPHTATCYNNVAFCLQGQGKAALALPLFEKGLAIWRKTLGEEHPATAQGYNNLAACLRAQGKAAPALPLFEKALAIFRKALGEDHPYTAGGYHNVADCLQAQGKAALALPLHEKALRIRRQVLGEDHPDTAASYNNVASCLQGQGKAALALPLHEKALAIRTRVLGEEHPLVARSYNNLARCLQDQGKVARALALFEKARAIHRKALGEEHPLTAQSYNNVAGNLGAQGKHAQAQPLYKRALAICTKALGEDHPDTAACSMHVALCLAAEGEYARAEREAARAARGYRAARLQVAFSGLERATFASRQSPLPLLAALQARNGKPGAAFATLERSLAPALLDHLAPGRALSAEHARHRQRLLERRAELEGQVQALLRSRSREAPARLAKLAAQRDEAQQRLGELEAELAQTYGPAAGQVFPTERIQKALPADAALLAWLDRPAVPGAKDPRGEHWACLLRARGEPTWLRLPGSGASAAWTEADEALAGRLRALLSGPGEADSWREPTRRLYEQRLAPLLSHLGKGAGLPAVRRLVVLPSPWMRGIPLEALLAARDRGGPGLVISYAPSGTLFAHLAERRAKRAGGQALLALGDPAFAAPPQPEKQPDPPEHGLLLSRVLPASSAHKAGLRSGDVLLRWGSTKLSRPDDLLAALKKPAEGAAVEVAYWRQGKSRTARLKPGPLGIALDRRPAALALRARREADALLARARGGGFRPLPGSRREVQALAALFAKAEVLLGERASEASLEHLADRLRGYTHLHFATHGMADAERPLESYLALADRDLPDPLQRLRQGRTPWTGRLSAAAILQSWRLDAELVVLSACQSGLGRYEHGEGYVGFAHALLLAGARSLVLSQWEADDEATALLMLRFYQNLLGKRAGLKRPLAKAAALAEAKQWLRNLSEKEAKVAAGSLPRGKVVRRTRPAVAGRPYAHPYYWAAFVLVGDPR